MGKKFDRLAYRAMLLFMMFICFFILLGSVRQMRYKVFTQVLSPWMRLLFPMLLAAMICAFLVLLYRALDCFNRRQLIVASVILFGIMTIFFLVMLFNFNLGSTGDAMHVQDVALYFARTGEVPLTRSAPHGNYFARFANNYFVVVVLRYYFQLCLFLGIQDMHWPLLVLSFAALMTSVVFVYLTGVLLGGMRRAVKFLLLCVMNPLYYLLVLWVYTNGLSVPFVTAGIYFSLRVYKAENARSRRIFCILTAVVAVLGYYVRATSVIPIIAVAICAFLWGLRSRKNMIRVLRCAVLCTVVAAILFKGISIVNDWHFSAVSDGNFPLTHWLMMASHGSGRHTYEDVGYTLQFETKAEKTKATLEKTIENYRKKSPTELLSFIYDKMVIVWGYGDGGDLMSNVSSDKKMTRLYSWLIGSQSSLFRAYGYAFRIVTLFMIIIAIWDLLRKKEIDPAQSLLILSLFGAILLYCFWEIKTKYSLPFVYIMLMIASNGIDVFGRSVSIVQTKIRRIGGIAAAVSLVCAFGICVLFYQNIVNSDVIMKDWSINGSLSASTNKLMPNEKKLELAQEVYISKPFNRILLAGNADETAVNAGDSAQLTLLNESGQVLYEKTIEARELADDKKIVIDTGRIIPEGREKYTIHIVKSDQCQGMLYFYCRSNWYMDIYDGVLTANGEVHRSDMILQIYNEYEGAWCSVKTARILTGALVLGILLLYLWMYLDARGDAKDVEITAN